MVKKITNFESRIYKLITKIPKGKVSTYKEVAKKISKKSYRAVGNALNKNPFAPRVPCHRIIKSNGDLGGFASGSMHKKKLLEKEGLKIKNNKIVDFEKKLYKF